MVHDREILYPPLLEAIPFIQYDPFLPPFRYKRETRYRMDVRDDFFGAFNYGIPKFYQRLIYPARTSQPCYYYPEMFAPRFWVIKSVKKFKFLHPRTLMQIQINTVKKKKLSSWLRWYKTKQLTVKLKEKV